MVKKKKGEEFHYVGRGLLRTALVRGASPFFIESVLPSHADDSRRINSRAGLLPDQKMGVSPIFGMADTFGDRGHV